MVDMGVSPQPQGQKKPFPVWEEGKEGTKEGRIQVLHLDHTFLGASLHGKELTEHTSENVRAPWWLSIRGDILT